MARQTEFPAPNSVSEVFDIAMVREREYFRGIPSPGPQDTCLDIGGGNKSIAGYQRLDWPDWDAEEKQQFPYRDGVLASVFCAHALDHMSAEGVIWTLREVDRCLRPGGVFTAVVPHYSTSLAAECIEHKSQFALKTWRNILANPAYDPHLNQEFPWSLEVGFNMVMGVEERNLVLVTQLFKADAVEVTKFGDVERHYV